MNKKVTFILLMLLFAVATNLNAAQKDVETIIAQSDKALETMRGGTRRMVITLKSGEQITNKWVARRAHKEFADGKRELMVLLEPEDIRGTAYMFWKPKDKPVMEWVYSPPTRRVRKLSMMNVYDSFFGTDFTYVDMDIKDPGGTSRLIGNEEYKGKKVYKVETVPEEQCYYSRIVSLIEMDTFFPIERSYYDAAGRLWKKKLFENVTIFNNTPIPLTVKMIDVQRNHSTEVTFSDICYDVDYLSKETFNPDKLPDAVFSPVCTVKLTP